MHKRSAQAWLLAGFLPFICLLVVALSLNSCSWFTSVSGVSRDSKGANSVLVTEGGSVTMLDRRTGRQIWRHQTGVTDFTPLIVNNIIYIVSQNPGGYNPDRTDMLEALSLALKPASTVWGYYCGCFSGPDIRLFAVGLHARYPGCLPASNGSQLWDYPTQSWIYHVVTDFN